VLPDGQWLSQPFFVIGTDAGSRRWLTQHHRRLLHLGAAGVLVNVESEAAYQRVVAIAPGLPIAPVAMPWLAMRLAPLRAAVYPLLVLPSGQLTQEPGSAQ
jgi:integrating conjugative element protein (TIGR03765 family)